MKHILIFIYLFVILLIQIDQQQAVPVYLSSSEDIQNYPMSWYDKFHDTEDRQDQHPIDHYYKRFIDDLLLPERQRRFGNTKYGRSILTD